jgi:hypothetical protein
MEWLWALVVQDIYALDMDFKAANVSFERKLLVVYIFLVPNLTQHIIIYLFALRFMARIDLFYCCGNPGLHKKNNFRIHLPNSQSRIIILFYHWLSGYSPKDYGNFIE